MWGNFIANWDRYYKLGETLIESRVVSRYYKVGQELLQSGSNNLLHSRAVATGKGGRYYKVGELYYKLG